LKNRLEKAGIFLSTSPASKRNKNMSLCLFLIFPTLSRAGR
jgi:hypothetical protein